MTFSTNARAVVAVFAAVALLTAALAPAASAQTMNASSAVAVFNRNLTIGSTGADVTALQNWLITKGHAIPAGATGYFGIQTRAALAAYQSASGIAPAAGFFGPITRGRLNANVTPGPAIPVPPVTDNDDDEDDDEELEVEVEFRNGRAYVEITEEDGDEDNFNIRTTSRTRVIEEVAERLDMDEDDIEDVIEFTTEDDDDEDEDEDDDGDNDRGNQSSAEAINVDGADNDYAIFKLTFDIEAFGDDMFIPRNADDAFTYRIEDASTGAAVSGETSLSADLSSDADEEGSSYLVREDDEEEFTITVNFNPLAADEGKNYRLQLLTVNFGDDAGEMGESSTLRPEGDFESESVFIAD